jgi:hypothetical protein
VCCDNGVGTTKAPTNAFVVVGNATTRSNERSGKRATLLLLSSGNEITRITTLTRRRIENKLLWPDNNGSLDRRRLSILCRRPPPLSFNGIIVVVVAVVAHCFGCQTLVELSRKRGRKELREIMSHCVPHP